MAKKKSAGKKKEKKAVKVAAGKKPAASKKKGAVLSVAVASVSKKNKKKPKKSKNGGGKAVDKNNNSNNHNQQSHFFESIFGPIRKQKGPSHDDSSNRKQKRKMAKLTLLKHPGRTSAKHEPPQKKQQPPKKKAKKKKSGTSGNNNSVSRNFFVRLPRTSDHKVPWLRNIKPPSISTYLPNRKKAAIATAAAAPAEASAKMAESSPSKNDVESSPSSSSILRLIRNIPQSELENLDNEIQSFAEYVQLSAKERRARQYVVDAVEQIVKDVVTSRRQLVDDVKCQVFGSFASQQVCTFQSDVDLAVWGVVPPDTGSNGSTRCNTHLRFNHEDSMEAPKSPMATTTPTESSDHPNRRKQAKIAKWKEALDAAVAAQAEATSDGSSKTDDVVTAESQTASQPTKNEEKPTGNAIVVDDKDDENDMEEFFVIDRVGVTTDETAVTTENSEGTSEDCPVIVDDKVSQSDDNGDINNNKSISESVAISSEEDTPTTVDNENIGKSVKGSEEGDNDDANDEEFSGGSDTGSISSGEDTADKLEGLNGAEDDDDDLVVDLAEDNDDYDVVVGSSKSDDDDESVVDLTKAAVTLESLLSLPDAEETFNGAVTDSDEQWTRIQAGAEDDDDSDDDDSDYEEEDENDEDYRSEVKRRRRTVSLCSSTTDQSDDDGLYKGTNMEVSFVSPAQSKDNSPNGQVRYYGSSVGMKKNAPSFGPTGEARTQVVKALNAIANRLRKFFSRRGKLDSPPLELCVRKHARVPIINMSTPFGYECDVALGGHNGTDTSHYAKTQSERFERYESCDIACKRLSATMQNNNASNASPLILLTGRQSFSKVVLVLKVLLSQQQLDKPFTGGLGSFKLYVLVAHHVSNSPRRHQG